MVVTKAITFSRIVLAIILLAINSHSSSAQSEWENVNSSYFKWGANSQLRISSNTLSNLTIWNYQTPSKENRSNDWISQDIEMNLNWIEPRPWRITFSIGNYCVFDEETRRKDNVYWGYQITVLTNRGLEKYIKYYCDRNNRTFTYDSDSREWRQSSRLFSRNVTIHYYGNNYMSIDTDEYRLHSFSGAKQLISIKICAGPAAEVHVTDFVAQRQSETAEVKAYISSGNSNYDSKDYWGAIEAYTKAIAKGGECYDVFYKRASSYYAMELYTNAIDDYTAAISYKATEDAYLYRGLAKLNKNDVSGIEDLRKGGVKGQALVREFEMDGGASSGKVGQKTMYQASGTGFFIDSRGYIATNYHVIEGAKGIDVLVTKNGETTAYSAKSIVFDKSNDLAIIKIIGSGFSGLSSIPYTFGSGIKDVGTAVFAMGYPELSYLGEEIKVTDGIISSKTGYQGDITTYQISAPIQHGNSGGPLFDNKGYVIGVTNAGVQALQNVGYAIKISYLKSLIEMSPEVINLPMTNRITSLSFTEKVKQISPYVVLIKTK